MAQTGVRIEDQTGAEAQGQPESENGPPALPGGAFMSHREAGAGCFRNLPSHQELVTLTIPSPGPHPLL